MPTITGTNGNDSLTGTPGNDTISGGSGDDYMNGGAGVDTFDGGPGNDRVSFYDLNATQGAVADLRTQKIANDGFGNAETMTSVEGLGDGTAFADTFDGDDNNNTLLGDSGDTLRGWGGDDSFQIDGAPALIDGGTGTNTISLFTQSHLVPANNGGPAHQIVTGKGVIVNLAEQEIWSDGFGGHGVVKNIQNLGGSAGDDILIGDGGNNVLWGNGGKDVIDGGAGNDTADFFGPQGDFEVIRLGNTVRVVGDGEDATLVNVETLAFNAGTPSQTTVAVSSLPAAQSSTLTIGAGFSAFIAKFKQDPQDLISSLLGGTSVVQTLQTDLSDSYTPLQLSTSQLAFQNPEGFLLIQGSNLHYTGSMSAPLDLDDINGTVTSATIYTGGTFNTSTHAVTGGTVAALATFSATQFTLTAGIDKIVFDGAGLPTDYATWLSIVNGDYTGSALSFSDIKLFKNNVQAASVTFASNHVTISAFGYTLVLNGTFDTSVGASVIDGSGFPTFEATGLTVTQDSTGATIASLSGLTTPIQAFGNNVDFLDALFSTVTTLNAATSTDTNSFLLPLGFGDESFDGFDITASGNVSSVTGGSGNDFVAFGEGSHSFDGGRGNDTVSYGAQSSIFQIVHNGDGSTTVTGPVGTDTLTHVELLKFQDKSIAIGTSAKADANGDGYSDLFWQNTSGQAAIWTINGLGQTGGAQVGGNPGPTWHMAGVGDFNNDSRADILWQNDSGQAAVWTMDGLNQIGGAQVGGNPGASWHVKGVGDFDGDGNADILWQNDNGQAAIWTMNGLTQTGGATVGGNPGNAWHVIGAGDFNGDGKSDILWQNTSGQVAIWTMDGLTQTGGATVGGNPGPSWHAIAAADFNGDGKADILWQNDSGQAAIWLMDGVNQIGAAQVGGNPGPTWHVKGAGDFNGDGKADILWQNDSGQVAIWTMDGLTQTGGGQVGGNPGSGWHIISGR